MTEISLQQMAEGVIDLPKNARDVGLNAEAQCREHKSLCVGFSLIFYNPDGECPEEDKWQHAAYIPTSDTVPDEFKIRAKAAMDYIATGVKRIWDGRNPNSTEVQH